MSHKFQAKTLALRLSRNLPGPRRPAGSCISTCYLSAVLCLIALACPGGLVAQSTQGLILGTVQDTSGAVVPGAEVRIVSLNEGSVRAVATDASGKYLALDLKPDRYRLEVSKFGFGHQVVPEVSLLARQELRQDFTLQVGAVSQEITVTGAATAINTENSGISASLDSRNVLDLPANYRASSGGTSPLALVQTLPGVQSDDGGTSFSVQGGLPSQSETSIDGISTQSTTSNYPLADAFPSAESIAELRVDGVGNNAEYGQPGEVTSISKAGTNNLHGGLFWYHQNRAFDATAFGAAGVKPQKIGNDFGFTLGGPVLIPHLYHGRNKTFFFTTYEGFRFPQGQSVQEIVPSTLMRTGISAKKWRRER
jgi:hypothetical protein